MALRLGFVGTGKTFDDVHFPGLKKIKGVKVTGIFDPDPVRSESASLKAECKIYPRFTDLLSSDDIDIVVITSPSKMHAGQAIEALRAGKDVIVDKPPALSLADFKKMVATAKKNGRKLFTFLNRRWDGDFITVKRTIGSGKLGKILYIEMNILYESYGGYGFFKRWRTTKKYGGGQLFDWGPHVIDHILQLVKSPVKSVWGDLRSLKWSKEVDDHAMLVIRFADGTVAKILLSGVIPHPGHLWFIAGEKGVLWQDEWETPANIRIISKGKKTDKVLPSAKTDWSMFYKVLEKAYQGQGKYPVDNDDVMRIMKIIEAARESSRTGETIRIWGW